MIGICASCDAPAREGARFCAGCGADLTAQPVLGAADLSAPARRPGEALALALFVYGAFLIGVIVSALEPVSLPRWAHDAWAALVAGAGLLALGRDRRGLFAWPRLTPRGVGLTAAGIAAALILAHLLALVWPLVLPIRSTYLAEGLGLGDAVLDFCVLAPIIEEVAFRGAILGALLRTLDRGAAVILTAFLFATIHLSPVSFGHLFLMGLICAEVRLRSRSLYLPMAVHAVYNAAVLTVDWLWLG